MQELIKDTYVLGPYNLMDLFNNPDNFKEFIFYPGYLIYRIHNLVTDKSYIGDTKENIYFRFWTCYFGSHFDGYLDGWNTHLYNSMRKYGLDKFELGIVYSGDYNEELEEKFISLYDSYYHGYNRSINGKSFTHGRSSEGKVWMTNNDGDLRYVKNTEIDYYKSNGYHLGFQNAWNLNKVMMNNGSKLTYVDSAEVNSYLINGYDFGAGDLNHTNKDGICIYKDNENKVVSKIQLDNYLNDGWKLGKNYGANSGKISVVKNDHQIYIDPAELDYFLSLGYRRGLKVVPMEGRTRIEKNGEYKIIDISDTDKYLSQGWKVWSSTRGRVHIYKGDKVKMIYPDELDIYLNEGWSEGMGSSSILGYIRIINKSEDRLVIEPTDENIIKYAKLGYARGNYWSSAQELWFFDEYKHLFSRELIDELSNSDLFKL